MNSVTVRKEELLDVLKKNRANHRDIYEQAMEGYKEKVRDELEMYLKRVENGDVLDIRVNLPRPEDHTEDYDRAIKMVQMSVDNVLELKEPEFAELVMDDWGWKRQFVQTASTYTER